MSHAFTDDLTGLLCEKPFTTLLSEADDLFSLSQAGEHLKLQLAFNHRWLSSYQHGFAKIRAGAIGRPIAGYARKNDTLFVATEMINWAAHSTPIHFLGAHDIDLMRWYLSRTESSVSCDFVWIRGSFLSSGSLIDCRYADTKSINGANSGKQTSQSTLTKRLPSLLLCALVTYFLTNSGRCGVASRHCWSQREPGCGRWQNSRRF